MSLSKTTVQHPVLVFIIFCLLMAVGAFTVTSLPIALMPDITFPMIIVSTTYENAGPESVEKSVTRTLESALTSVRGLKKVTSQSREGMSIVMLEFFYGQNLDEATSDIRDKLDRVKNALPSGAKTPSVMRMNASSMPIMRIAVRGNRTASELKKIADDNVTNRLEQVDGVAQASTNGGSQRIVRVELSQNRLEAYNLTLMAISSTLATQNLEIGGGKIVDSSLNYVIRTTGEYQSIDEIANTVVAVRNGYDVRLSDIGNVGWGYADATSAVYINGEPGVYVSVTKTTDGNVVRVTDAVYAKLQEIQQFVPADVTLDVIVDDSDVVRETIQELFGSLRDGVLLAMGILFLFLRSFKTTLIIGFSIPISMILALMVMHFSNMTLNMVTMTGLILGLGMIVDASIVILESIFGYRERGAKARVAAELGTQEVWVSVFSGNMTTLCVFLPFLIFKRDMEMMGEMFFGMIVTICFSLLSSLFVATFLVPVLAGHFMPLTSRKEKPIRNPAFKAFDSGCQRVLDKIADGYGSALNFAVGHKKIIVAATFILCVGSLVSIMKLGIRLMPNVKEEQVNVTIKLPLGTPLAKSEEVAFQFAKIIEDEVQGYETLMMSCGGGGMFSSESGEYKSTLTIKLPPFEEQIDDSETIRTKLRKHFNDFPEATISFGSRSMSTGSDIKVSVRSDDLNAALNVAKEFRDTMEEMDDLGDAAIDINEGLPQVGVVIDRARAYSFGLSVSAIAQEINASINGQRATVYREAGKDYDVQVMYDVADRSSLPDLEQIFVVSATAGKVPVSNFAHFEKGVGPVTIMRENQTRVVNVTAEILNTKMTASEMEKKVIENYKNKYVLADGVNYIMTGAQKDVQTQKNAFFKIIILALLLVFGVMAGTYESFRDPLINMMTIPLFIIGVALMHIIVGQMLSIGSLIGMVMLIGIVVNNGIILVDQMNLLVRRGMEPRAAAIDAGKSRLRPVLMTTLTTILGMIPMCFSKSGTAAFIKPIGYTVIGGLVSSTAVTLFVIPVLYLIFHGGKKRQKQLRQIPASEQEMRQRLEMRIAEVQEASRKKLEAKIAERRAEAKKALAAKIADEQKESRRFLEEMIACEEAESERLLAEAIENEKAKVKQRIEAETAKNSGK